MPVPVIQCDACGIAVPARFEPHGTIQEQVTASQREADLRGQGWTLTDTQDLCPGCTSAVSQKAAP